MRISPTLAALALVSLACASTTTPPLSPPVGPLPAAHPTGFTILHVNDTYKIEGLEQGRYGGMARLRTVRKALEAEGKPVLVTHGGDFLFPSVMSKYLKGGPMIEALNLLDGDPAAFDENLIVTLGNHEFDDKDPGVVLGRMAQSDFPWLTTNVLYRSAGAGAAQSFSNRVARVADLVVRDLGGIRVGLFSLTLDDEPAAWLTYGFELEARRATVAESIRRLRAQGATLILALTHQSLDQDEWLAREFPEIPLILGGHEHIAIDRTIGQTRIVKADADAKTVVRIEVRPGSTGLEFSPRWLTLDGSVAPDPQVAAFTTAAIARMGSALRRATGRAIDTVYGSTEHALEGLETAIRTRETALGNFLTDVLRQRLGAQIGLVNGGAVRINDDIPAGGRITEYELEGIFYFDNKPVGFELAGQELYDLLAKSISQPDLGHGRFLQVSGLRFRYHVQGQGFDRTYSMTPADVEIGTAETGFVPLALAARYTVASLDYIWENGYRDGYPIFSKGNPKVGSSPPRFDDPKKPLSWRRITEEAIAALPENRVTTNIEGRIVRVEERN